MNNCEDNKLHLTNPVLNDSDAIHIFHYHLQLVIKSKNALVDSNPLSLEPLIRGEGTG